MHFYGIGYRELLALPIRFFWTLNNNIDRIQSSFELRALNLQHVAVATGMAGGDGVKKYATSLELQIGEVQKIKFDPMAEKFDKAGFDSLKDSIRRQNKKNK